MPHAYGYRAGTRDLFKRGFRRHGAPKLSTYLIDYKKGDFVDVVGDGSAHKGMPHKYYHGKTGRVFNVNPNSIGVVMNKRVRNRIQPKRLHVRVEHLRMSTCQTNFKTRVKNLEAEKRKKGPKQPRKRMALAPKGEFTVVPGKSNVIFQNAMFHKEIF
jgi:large subunit ribosomal protein L21e